MMYDDWRQRGGTAPLLAIFAAAHRFYVDGKKFSCNFFRDNNKWENFYFCGPLFIFFVLFFTNLVYFGFGPDGKNIPSQFTYSFDKYVDPWKINLLACLYWNNLIVFRFKPKQQIQQRAIGNYLNKLSIFQCDKFKWIRL